MYKVYHVFSFDILTGVSPKKRSQHETLKEAQKAVEGAIKRSIKKRDAEGLVSIAHHEGVDPTTKKVQFESAIVLNDWPVEIWVIKQ